MLTITDLKTGTTFKYDESPYLVLEYQHSKMGRGGAVLRTKIKNLVTGTIVNKTFKSSDTFESIRIEQKKVQFLYRENGRFFFMNQDDYSQFDLSSEDLGENINYLKEGETVQFKYYAGKPIDLELPIKMSFTVIEAGGGERGNTVSATTKPIKIETGLAVNAPLFIKKGDEIVIDTRSGEYVERAS